MRHSWRFFFLCSVRHPALHFMQEIQCLFCFLSFSHNFLLSSHSLWTCLRIHVLSFNCYRVSHTRRWGMTWKETSVLHVLINSDSYLTVCLLSKHALELLCIQKESGSRLFPLTTFSKSSLFHLYLPLRYQHTITAVSLLRERIRRSIKTALPRNLARSCSLTLSSDGTCACEENERCSWEKVGDRQCICEWERRRRRIVKEQEAIKWQKLTVRFISGPWKRADDACDKTYLVPFPDSLNLFFGNLLLYPFFRQRDKHAQATNTERTYFSWKGRTACRLFPYPFLWFSQ